MARNLPVDASADALRRLARAVRSGMYKAFRVPEVNAAPGEDTNAWISLADGRLYWRSPDGTIQAAGEGGHGAASFETAYSTHLAVLSCTGARTDPADASGALAWGARGRSIARLGGETIGADAEILAVEVFAYSLEADAGADQIALYVAPVDFAGYDPLAPIRAVSFGYVPRVGGAWFAVARSFGEAWRDGTADGVAFLTDARRPDAGGLLAGPDSAAGLAPMARVHYQMPT